MTGALYFIIPAVLALAILLQGRANRKRDKARFRIVHKHIVDGKVIYKEAV